MSGFISQAYFLFNIPSVAKCSLLFLISFRSALVAVDFPVGTDISGEMNWCTDHLRRLTVPVCKKEGYNQVKKKYKCNRLE